MPVLRDILLPRLSFAVSLLWSLLSQMVWWASPAEAQGFLQQLLGLSTPQVQTAPRASAPRQPLGGAPMLITAPPPSARWVAVRPGSDLSGGNSRPGKEGSGGYTTVCVRLCDGFYFPISHKAPRSRFYRDADACRSRCSESASQLFYYPSSGGDMRSAVDLTGRAYARLPIAFMHRKKMIQGCGCRPEPWSVASLARHEGYAIAEGIVTVAGHRSQGSLTVVAGNYPDAPAADRGQSAGDGDGEAVPAAEIEGTTEKASSANGGEAAGQLVQSSAEAPSPTAGAGGAPPRRSAAQINSRAPRQVQRAAVPKPAPVAAARSKAPRMAAASPAPKMLWPGDAPVRTR